MDNIPEMESCGASYIMPLRGSDRLNDVIGEVDAGGDPVREYTMTDGDGRQFVSTLVVVCPKKNQPKKAKTAGRYVAFITNARVDDPGDPLRLMPKTYRKRWGMRPDTTS